MKDNPKSLQLDHAGAKGRKFVASWTLQNQKKKSVQAQNAAGPILPALFFPAQLSIGTVLT